MFRPHQLHLFVPAICLFSSSVSASFPEISGAEHADSAVEVEQPAVTNSIDGSNLIPLLEYVDDIDDRAELERLGHGKTPSRQWLSRQDVTTSRSEAGGSEDDELFLPTGEDEDDGLLLPIGTVEESDNYDSFSFPNDRTIRAKSDCGTVWHHTRRRVRQRHYGLYSKVRFNIETKTFLGSATDPNSCARTPFDAVKLKHEGYLIKEHCSYNDYTGCRYREQRWVKLHSTEKKNHHEHLSYKKKTIYVRAKCSYTKHYITYGGRTHEITRQSRHCKGDYS